MEQSLIQKLHNIAAESFSQDYINIARTLRRRYIKYRKFHFSLFKSCTVSHTVPGSLDFPIFDGQIYHVATLNLLQGPLHMLIFWDGVSDFGISELHSDLF